MAVAGAVDDGLDTHVDAGKALAVTHIRRAVLRVVMRVSVHGVAAVGGGGGGGGRRGDGGAITRRVTSRGGVVVLGGTVGDGHGVLVHGRVARCCCRGRRAPAGVVRVHARGRLGAAVRRVEVIYWSQTNAGNPAVVVIPMDRVALFQPLATGTRPRRRLEVLEAVVHALFVFEKVSSGQSSGSFICLVTYIYVCVCVWKGGRVGRKKGEGKGAS